jgi:transcriptional regulator with XRE-family HTH domain
MVRFDDDATVRPDGLGIRRRRRHLGWSRAELVTAIGARSREATGVPETLTRNLLQGIEEANERVAYRTLCLVALGLDCNPVELVLEEGAADEVQGTFEKGTGLN